MLTFYEGCGINYSHNGMSIFKSSGGVPELFLFSVIKRKTAATCGGLRIRKFSAGPGFFVLKSEEESFLRR